MASGCTSPLQKHVCASPPPHLCLSWQSTRCWFYLFHTREKSQNPVHFLLGSHDHMILRIPSKLRPVKLSSFPQLLWLLPFLHSIHTYMHTCKYTHQWQWGTKVGSSSFTSVWDPILFRLILLFYKEAHWPYLFFIYVDHGKEVVTVYATGPWNGCHPGSWWTWWWYDWYWRWPWWCHWRGRRLEIHTRRQHSSPVPKGLKWPLFFYHRGSLVCEDCFPRKASLICLAAFVTYYQSLNGWSLRESYASFLTNQKQIKKTFS